ncbi:Aldehyde/histidinol dehydrogenase [Xylaria flabelliformis]|nr:Aldehyde/histidinol dehydrogenase [Xylaria flabelliformis]
MALYTVPLIINGEEYTPQGTFEVRSPDTGELLHLCSLATETDAKTAVEAAAAASSAWRSTNPATRRDVCLKAADLMNQRREDLEKCFAAEIGIGGHWATINVDTTISMLRDVAGRVSTLEGSVPNVADPNTSASEYPYFEPQHQPPRTTETRYLTYHSFRTYTSSI